MSPEQNSSLCVVRAPRTPHDSAGTFICAAFSGPAARSAVPFPASPMERVRLLGERVIPMREKVISPSPSWAAPSLRVCSPRQRGASPKGFRASPADFGGSPAGSWASPFHFSASPFEKVSAPFQGVNGISTSKPPISTSNGAKTPPAGCFYTVSSRKGRAGCPQPAATASSERPSGALRTAAPHPAFAPSARRQTPSARLSPFNSKLQTPNP